VYIQLSCDITRIEVARQIDACYNISTGHFSEDIVIVIDYDITIRNIYYAFAPLLDPR
jgi:hypothetical protein